MIVRYTFSTRIGKEVDVNGIPYIIKRQVFWKKAIEGQLHWQYNYDKSSIPPWKYFYYEVEPVEKRDKKETS